MLNKDYAKYIINNINRAVIGNALQIGNKIDTQDGYAFTELLNNIQDYLVELLSQNKIDKDKCYSIFYIVKESLKKYNSNFKYVKKYIINDFIIELWKIMHEE